MPVAALPPALLDSCPRVACFPAAQTETAKQIRSSPNVDSVSAAAVFVSGEGNEFWHTRGKTHPLLSSQAALYMLFLVFELEVDARLRV